MPKTILIVDDSGTIRQQLRATLGGAGFDVLEAADGLEALDQLDKHPEVALMILDINMPKMSGLDMLEKLRSESRCSTVPVLMLTTEGHPTLMDRARKAGAKGWVVKPYKPDLLVGAIRKMVAA
jgi:two-component system chemotaxis response regulator CheY